VNVAIGAGWLRCPICLEPDNEGRQEVLTMYIGGGLFVVILIVLLLLVLL